MATPGPSSSSMARMTAQQALDMFHSMAMEYDYDSSLSGFSDEGSVHEIQNTRSSDRSSGESDDEEDQTRPTALCYNHVLVREENVARNQLLWGKIVDLALVVPLQHYHCQHGGILIMVTRPAIVFPLSRNVNLG